MHGNASGMRLQVQVQRIREQTDEGHWWIQFTPFPLGKVRKIFAISTALIDSIGSGASNCLFMDAGSSTLNYMGFGARDT
jgi:hypothetical protein